MKTEWTLVPPAQAKAEAMAKFADQGPGHINCAQAVLAFALAVRGMDPALLSAAGYFGGGLAGMGEVCGAVSGAALALGLRDYDAQQQLPAQKPSARAPKANAQSPIDPKATREALQELMRGFAAEFGHTGCRDLTGYDLTTPAGHDAFVKSGVNERCKLFVGWMCDRLLPLLQSEA